MARKTNVNAPTAVGIDIGGSGVKAATVDVLAGAMATDRVRVPTPDPPTPERTVDAILGLLDELDAPAMGPVGVGFPGVIRDGVIKTAANLDPSWVDVDGVALFSERLGHPAHLINDADAAGLAEVRFGAGAGVGGVVLMLTLGTGIGSGLFHNGMLVPNTEFGHLDMGGKAAEARASSAVRKKQGLSWKKWGREVDLVLAEVERLFWPDLIIIGGGVSKRFDEFSPYLDRTTPIVRAALGNHAGIIGAALWAAEKENP